MRNIIIELQIDWEGYEDVSDELIVEDAIEAKVNGVGWTLLPKKETPFSEEDMIELLQWFNYCFLKGLHEDKTTQEMLKIWQEQRTKTIYCE